MAKKIHGTRALLNLPGCQSTAAIVAEIDSTRGMPSEDYPRWGPESTLQVSDCDRSISFDIGSFEDADERKNNLHKVDTLIAALQAFRKGLVYEQNRWVRENGP